MLVVVANHHRWSGDEATTRRVAHAGEEVEQRGFAGTVGPHDGEAVARSDEEVHVAKYRRCAVEGDADVLELEHLVPEACHLGLEGEVSASRCGLRSAVEEGMSRSDSSLWLSSSSLRATAEPRQFSSGEVLPRGLSRGGVFVSGGDGFEVGAVATVVGEGSTPVEFDHLRRESVEEVAIVGDEDNRGCGGGEPLFEPEDSGEVEVVGGLVQDQQVHLFCGGGRQGDALGLSS